MERSRLHSPWFSYAMLPVIVYLALAYSSVLSFSQLLAQQSTSAPNRVATPSTAAATALVFQAVTVIDVTDGRLLPDQTVVVAGNRVQAVGPADQVRVPSGAQVVDARGKYLVPGFWDMHPHVDDGPGHLYPLFIAHGVTGIREMAQRGAFPDSFRVWQREVMAGTRVGPRGVGPSADLSGIAIETPQVAMHIVDSLKTVGDAFIKFHGDPDDREIFFAILREARRVGIPVVGHVPFSVGSIEAADSGMYSIEHLTSHYQECFGWPQPLDTTDSATREGCTQVAQALIRNGTWMVPTMTRLHFVRRNGLLGQQFARLMHQLGVKNFLTGTDYVDFDDDGVPHLRNGVRKARAGLEVLDDILLLAGAGLTPLEALQATTLNPAKYLHGTDSLGTVAAGKLADLVLLDANPLADIRNVRHIRAVVANGRYVDRTALDALDPEGVQVEQANEFLEQQLALKRQPAPAAKDLAFRGVTVIDVTTGRRLGNQTVVVVGNRVQAMGPAREVRVPSGAQVVDAQGKYLIPGLWDMHAVVSDPDFYRYISRQDSIYHGLYPRFIAHGVTGIREIAQYFQHGADSLRAWQHAIQAGTRVGPRVIGPSVDVNYGRETGDWNYGVQIGQPDDARAIMDSLKAAGDAFVTFHDNSMAPDLYFALVREARRVRLPLVGPVPQGVTNVVAADSGQRSIERIRAQHQCWPDWPGALDSTATAAPCAAAAQAYVRDSTWLVPGLVEAQYGEQNVSTAQTVVRQLRRGGVRRFLAGTAISLQAMAVAPRFRPGVSAGEEVVLLAGAGLTPLEALQAGTLNPAEFIHATDSLGTVAPGKLADLILLDGDPLADIHNVLNIRAVVANGRYFDRALLNTLDPEPVGLAKGSAEEQPSSARVPRTTP